jgi:phosphatidylinositol alpha-1,6-mannosyltransferase
MGDALPEAAAAGGARGDAGACDILFGAMTLKAGAGGIARVARLMARVVAEEADQLGRRARVLVLGDDQVETDVPLPAALAGRSRLLFAARALRASLRCRHFIYDGCHLAQVHRLPGLRRRPFLTFLHGIEIWENAKPGYVRAARRARMLLSNSDYTRRRAARLHGPDFARARVCWLATESDEPPPPRMSWDGPPEVLIVGRLEAGRYKGHRQLIACWPEVVRAVPGAVLRIVGQGPDYEPLCELVRQSPAGPQIVFDGFVPEAELERLYAHAAAFAMPSRGEGFGLVYIEAMRHGLSVIGSNEDAAGEVVLDGETGFIVDPGRPGELAERVITLLHDRDLARRMGEAGRRRWAEHFRYSAFRDRFRPLLREFLES